jgi:type I restriction enzyme S subunit
MVSKKRYDNYKPSGVEWLEEIPAHWQVKDLKHLCSICAEYGLNEAAESYQSSGIRFLRTSDIDDFGNITDDGVYLDEELTKKTLLESGDLLISRSGTIGRTLLFDSAKHGPSSWAGYLVRYRPIQQIIEPRYLFLFSKTLNYVDWLSTQTISSTIGNVNGQKFANMPIPVPPLPEQQAIVRFLEERTGKIDALIAHKQQLLNLLAEKRSALITQAVTKGLDPSVPLKPSGVEWLGDIPAHWEVKRLKHLALKIGSGVTPTGGANVYGSQGVAFLRSQNIHFNGLKLDDVVFIDDQIDQDMKETRVHYGDILLNITGASLGRATCFDIKNYPANVNQHVCIIRLDHNYFNFRFYTYYVSSRALQDQIFGNQQGVSREALNFEQLGNLLFVFPLDTEQQAIVAYLDERLQKLDAVKAALLTAIDRLKEYRSALITSAVTGKIDVRHLQPKETLSV